MVLVLMTFMSVGVLALEYTTIGYNQATINIQNNLDPYYDDFFDFAVDAWNDAGVIDRSIVVNTQSDSEIRNFNFDDDSDYMLDSWMGTKGLYEVTVESSLSCDCHTAAAFEILINDFYVWDPAAEREGKLSTDNEVKGTIVHELGHAFGLEDFFKEENVLNSIMSYALDMDVTYTPQTRDVNNANVCWAPHR